MMMMMMTEYRTRMSPDDDRVPQATHMQKRRVRRPHAPQPISQKTRADGQRLMETKSSPNVRKSPRRPDDTEHSTYANRRKTGDPHIHRASQRNEHVERGPMMTEQEPRNCCCHPDATMDVERGPLLAAGARRREPKSRLRPSKVQGPAGRRPPTRRGKGAKTDHPPR